MAFKEGLTVFKHFFISQTHKNGNLLIFNWWMTGSYTIFLVFHVYLRISVTKRRSIRTEHCKKTLLFNYLSFPQVMQSIYLSNQPSPDIQLSLNLPKFPNPVNAQLPFLLQRWRICLLKLEVYEGSSRMKKRIRGHRQHCGDCRAGVWEC